MQLNSFTQLLICLLFFAIGCEKGVKDPTLSDFCHIKPKGWDCEFIENNFSSNDFPDNAEAPVAIIKYRHPDREFIMFKDSMVHSSLILNIYSINQKQELIELIKSQPSNIWCRPIYYGETKKYFIITSPCLINNGSDTDEAYFCISDLQKALESIITVNDYNFLGGWIL